eukprot:TRINITY_DN5059_c0_g1_i1.p1 TRINITY_DN5059_c0_g1~~TRINITY_DN5059_c0_g1_i1.p1  ORF type:complete len:597 (+),score=64.77 TRINITY_DN5059_c0_g1_i1:28-1818(+)
MCIRDRVSTQSTGEKERSPMVPRVAYPVLWIMFGAGATPQVFDIVVDCTNASAPSQVLPAASLLPGLLLSQAELCDRLKDIQSKNSPANVALEVEVRLDHPKQRWARYIGTQGQWSAAVFLLLALCACWFKRSGRANLKSLGEFRGCLERLALSTNPPEPDVPARLTSCARWALTAHVWCTICCQVHSGARFKAALLVPAGIFLVAARTRADTLRRLLEVSVLSPGLVSIWLIQQGLLDLAPLKVVLSYLCFPVYCAAVYTTFSGFLVTTGVFAAVVSYYSSLREDGTGETLNWASMCFWLLGCALFLVKSLELHDSWARVQQALQVKVAAWIVLMFALAFASGIVKTPSFSDLRDEDKQRAWRLLAGGAAFGSFVCRFPPAFLAAHFSCYDLTDDVRGMRIMETVSRNVTLLFLLRLGITTLFLFQQEGLRAAFWPVVLVGVMVALVGTRPSYLWVQTARIFGLCVLIPVFLWWLPGNLWIICMGYPLSGAIMHVTLAAQLSDCLALNCALFLVEDQALRTASATVTVLSSLAYCIKVSVIQASGGGPIYSWGGSSEALPDLKRVHTGEASSIKSGDITSASRIGGQSCELSGEA